MPNNEASPSAGARTKRYLTWMAVLAICYVAAVLGADFLATMNFRWPFRWGYYLSWKPNMLFLWATKAGIDPDYLDLFRLSALKRFDYFKFLFWLVVPLLICVWRMDWRAWWVGRWKRVDWLLLLGIVLVGVGVMASINLFPSLQKTYPSLSHLSPEKKWDAFWVMTWWNVSWLFGWEFMHRYMLLRAVDARWTRFGWLLVPLSETLYHASKPGLEMVGMAIFGLALTWWARKRNNILLPLIAHAIIEIELMLFLLLAPGG